MGVEQWALQRVLITIMVFLISTLKKVKEDLTP